MNCKTKSFMTKKKAFTLIELLIVIAIIGILFIVLVSKVDFATDKAKATGVQTDFRSFQMAFDTVAKENAGFNTFGWDTGDLNANGKRDSYDEGDANQNGKQDPSEVWTGHKIYAETFTKVYSLKKNGTGSYDRDALNRLETAINANLDPKLHITIKDDGEIVMANGAQDPWNKEYHGWYITNAETDGLDRGAIVLYSDGANNEFGSEHKIENGVVTVSVPGSNKAGKDDYSIVSLYTYVNGYGEVKNMTTGFSNNQTIGGGSGSNLGGGEVVTPPTPIDYEIIDGANETFTQNETTLEFRSNADYDKFVEVKVDGSVVDPSNYTVTEGSTVVTFTKSFFDSLGEGEHTVEIVSEDGVAEASFEVAKPTIPAENPSGTINSYSWDEIKYLAGLQLSKEEYKSKYGIELGQSKDNKYYLVDLDGNEYNGFVFMYNPGVTLAMNDTNTNAGGYAGSQLAPKIEDLYNNLTDTALKDVIKNVYVTCNDGETNNAALYAYECHMFIPSQNELGLAGYSNLYHYDLLGNVFDGVNSTIRKTISKSSLFRTRTAVSSKTTNFFAVKSSGTEGDSVGATGACTVVCCFVVGEAPAEKQNFIYSVCDGANTKFTPESDVVFTVNATVDKLVAIKINGTVLDSNNYVVSSGTAEGEDVFYNASKIVLNKAYCESLSDGIYSIDIVFTDGVASSNFEWKFKTNNSYSWSEIKSIAQLNLTAEEYKSQYGIVVGDSKVDNGIAYVLVDLGTDNTDYNGFVFMYNACSEMSMVPWSNPDGTEYNSGAYNRGGYAVSKIYTKLETVYTNLASSNVDLYNVISEQSIVYNDGTNVDYINAHIFLASATEVGYTSLTFNDGAKFDLFSDNASRKMVEVDTYGYWLRTAEAEYDTSFYYVSSRNGSIDVMAAVNGCGVIACFVIG